MVKELYNELMDAYGQPTTESSMENTITHMIDADDINMNGFTFFYDDWNVPGEWSFKFTDNNEVGMRMRIDYQDGDALIKVSYAPVY